MVGLTYRLGLLKVQMPLYSYQISPGRRLQAVQILYFLSELKGSNPVKLTDSLCNHKERML